MNYKIVERTSKDALIQEVENLIQQEWIPLGGLAFCVLSSGGVLYSQAMVKNTADKPEQGTYNSSFFPIKIMYKDGQQEVIQKIEDMPLRDFFTVIETKVKMAMEE